LWLQSGMDSSAVEAWDDRRRHCSGTSIATFKFWPLAKFNQPCFATFFSNHSTT
jgi:hypothetical protein